MNCPKCGKARVEAFPIDTTTKAADRLPKAYHEICWCEMFDCSEYPKTDVTKTTKHYAEIKP